MKEENDEYLQENFSETGVCEDEECNDYPEGNLLP